MAWPHQQQRSAPLFPPPPVAAVAAVPETVLANNLSPAGGVVEAREGAEKKEGHIRFRHRHHWHHHLPVQEKWTEEKGEGDRDRRREVGYNPSLTITTSICIITAYTI